MAVYSAPEGFIWDPSTGSYVRETILTDDAGIKYRHRMFFDADTGEYTQYSEPLEEEAHADIPPAPPAPPAPPVDIPPAPHASSTLPMQDAAPPAPPMQDAAPQMIPPAPPSKAVKGGQLRPKKKRVVLKTILVAVPIIVVIGVILMVISYKQSYPNDVPDLTENEISDIITELQLDTVPEMTVDMQEHTGTIDEEGIIR